MTPGAALVPWIVRLAAVLGLSGVALGAWAAHGLAEFVGPTYVAIAAETSESADDLLAKRVGDFRTGVRYQMTHAVTLLALAGLPVRRRRATAILLTAGTTIFSGSLYLLVLTATPAWGAVTPIGGGLLLIGWITLFVGAGPPVGDPAAAAE